MRTRSRTVISKDPVTEAVTANAAITRYVEAEAGDARARCWLRLEYRARDPLAVRVAMCAPSQAVVTERVLLRADVRDGLQRRIYYPDVVLTPDGLRGKMLFRFRERQIAVTVIVPARAIAAFIRETDELVSFGAGEVDALNAGLALLENESLPKR